MRTFQFMNRQICIIAAVLSCFVLLVVPSVAVPTTYAAGTPVFGSAVNLSHDSGKATEPAVSSNGDNVYVAWTEGSGGLFFRASSDGGKIWVPPLTSAALKISNPGHTTQFPVMFTQNQSVAGGTVLISWAQAVGSTGLQIFAAVSTNNGVSFKTTQVSTRGRNYSCCRSIWVKLVHDLVPDYRVFFERGRRMHCSKRQ